ncbi:response regulator transcription factor [Nocardioides marmoribigeumensis]|uniref:DNA-binding response OmpR family regulator n=1 Tax=Nocardioides marmoribigeumensis TaxID=433649 RepID=A0ABU2BU70_9ACTN|nr:DNA-binding response OmpR family regulator [Nocardioides marmoribigeumensis]
MIPQLLVVEDDDGIAVPLVRTLEREGYAVERVATGSAGLERASRGDLDLVVLDLGLPDLDGLDVCRQLRSDGFPGGILILTARGGELDRVVGLDVGADDYLGKPFALAELLARTRALLRRAHRVPPADAGEQAVPAAPADGLRVDPQARRVWVEDREVGLTSKEFDLLALLDSERGAVLTRERLMDEVWDENWFGSTKTLDVTMGRLRQKLQESAAPVQIVTVRGVGFRLEAG